MSKNFEELLAELEATAEEQDTLAKALPQDDGADDEAIQAAAAENADDDSADESDEPADDAGEVDDGGEADDSGNEDEPTLTKSMVIDGEDVEIIDGEQLMKSLSELGDRLNASEQTLAKALESTLGTIKNQGAMIKSLNERLDKLAGQGRGRKAVVSVVEKPTPLAKSQEQDAPQPGQLMAKALDAQRSGKLTGLDVARCESALNSGGSFPADVLAKLQ